MAKSNAEKFQTILGVEPDGIWGPKSQRALNTQIEGTGATGDPTLIKIQKLLGVDADGFWGPKSQKALNQALAGGGGSAGGIRATASSFADPADVRAFERCKATGRTDKQCFAVGDNGIGKWGANTAQTTTPMVAVHPRDAVAKWGSMNAAAHRSVRVTVGNKSVAATVEDQLGVAGRIDLNPAAAAKLGLNPPFTVPCVWEWV